MIHQLPSPHAQLLIRDSTMCFRCYHPIHNNVLECLGLSANDGFAEGYRFIKEIIRNSILQI